MWTRTSVSPQRGASLPFVKRTSAEPTMASCRERRKRTHSGHDGCTSMPPRFQASTHPGHYRGINGTSAARRMLPGRSVCEKHSRQRRTRSDPASRARKTHSDQMNGLFQLSKNLRLDALVVLHNDSDRFGIRAPQVEATTNASSDAVTICFRDTGTEGALVALCAIPGNSVVQNH